MIEERNQDDDWNRNAEKPEQNAATHTTLLNECAHQKTGELFGCSLPFPQGSDLAGDGLLSAP